MLSEKAKKRAFSPSRDDWKGRGDRGLSGSVQKDLSEGKPAGEKDRSNKKVVKNTF